MKYVVMLYNTCFKSASFLKQQVIYLSSEIVKYSFTTYCNCMYKTKKKLLIVDWSIAAKNCFLTNIFQAMAFANPTEEKKTLLLYTYPISSKNAGLILIKIYEVEESKEKFLFPCLTNINAYFLFLFIKRIFLFFLITITKYY